MAVSLTARKYVRIEIDHKTFSALLNRHKFDINIAYGLADVSGHSVFLDYIIVAKSHNPYTWHTAVYGCSTDAGSIYFGTLCTPGTYRKSPYPDPHLNYCFMSEGTHAEFYVLENAHNFWWSEHPEHDSAAAGIVLWKRMGTPTLIHDDSPKPDNWVWGGGYFNLVPTNDNYKIFRVQVNPDGLLTAIGDNLHILFGYFRPYIFIKEERVEYAFAKVSNYTYQTIYEVLLGSPLGPWTDDTPYAIHGTPLEDTILNIAWGECYCTDVTCPTSITSYTPARYHSHFGRLVSIDPTQTYEPLLVVRSDFSDAYAENGDFITVSSWEDVVWPNEDGTDIVTEEIIDDAVVVHETDYDEPSGRLILDELDMRFLLTRHGIILSKVELTATCDVDMYGSSDKYLFHRKWLGTSYELLISPAYAYTPPHYIPASELMFKREFLCWQVAPHEAYPSERYLNIEESYGTLYSRVYHSRYCNPSTEDLIYDISQPPGWIKCTFLDEHHPFFDFSETTWAALRNQTGQSFTFL